MAGTARRPRAVLLPIVVVMLCFCAICAHVLIDARRAAWERAGDVAENLQAAIEGDIVRNIETLDLSLRAVVDGLKHPNIEKIDPELRQLVLFDRSASARHLGAILVLDENGILRLDSRSTAVKPADLSDRDYFKAHRNGKSAVLYIGKPQSGVQHDQPFIGISRRLTNAHGSFSGVAAGSLRLTHLQEMFRSFSFGSDSRIALLHLDGTVVMRWPHGESYTGRNIRHAAIFKHLAKSKSGRFDSLAVSDGVHRLVVYRQIKDLPIVVAIGQSTHEV
jgi:hypothetical protein